MRRVRPSAINAARRWFERSDGWNTPNHIANSNRPGQRRPDQSVPPTAEEYAERVAGPAMAAVDALPALWRQNVNEHGFVDVYLAWRRGLPPQVVHECAERVGGFFVL